MGKNMFGGLLVFIGTLVASCGSLEQFDHNNPVKPESMVIDTARVERIRNLNSGHWNHSAKAEIVNRGEL